MCVLLLLPCCGNCAGIVWVIFRDTFWGLGQNVLRASLLLLCASSSHARRLVTRLVRSYGPGDIVGVFPQNRSLGDAMVIWGIEEVPEPYDLSSTWQT